MQAVNQLGDANEVLNERAVAVMARMSHKLTGRDFSSGSASGAGSSTQHGSEHWSSGDARDTEPGLSVKVQVQKLILQATSHENLCQNYVGYVLIILPYPISRNCLYSLFDACCYFVSQVVPFLVSSCASSSCLACKYCKYRVHASIVVCCLYVTCSTVSSRITFVNERCL